MGVEHKKARDLPVVGLERYIPCLGLLFSLVSLASLVAREQGMFNPNSPHHITEFPPE